MYRVAVSDPVKITTLVAPLADTPAQTCTWGGVLWSAHHSRWFSLLVIGCLAMGHELNRTFISPYDVIQIQIVSNHSVQAPLHPLFFIDLTYQLEVSSTLSSPSHPRCLRTLFSVDITEASTVGWAFW